MKNKNIKSLFCLLAVIFAACAISCQNNGDIGRYFGTWRLESYTVDGNKVEEVTIDGNTVPTTNVTFSFQNNIVNVVTIIDDYESYYSRFGTWEDEGSTFVLDFTHTDATDTAPGTGQYAAPEWLGMVSDMPMHMALSGTGNKDFTLTWNDPEGSVRVYSLHKTW